MIYVIPSIILITIVASAIKKVSVYDSFIDGSKDALSLTVKLLPYLISIFILIEIFSQSGLETQLARILATPLSYLGIPKELIGLIVIRPLSGSGSLGILENLLATYGADSYIGRCACVISGCNDTIFYIVAVYTAKCEDKKTGLAIPISIVASFLGVLASCFICRFL